MKATFSHWQDDDKRYAVVRVDDSDASAAEAQSFQHGDEITVTHGSKIPCPGIPLDDGAFSGCAGGDDCPVCGGNLDWLTKLIDAHLMNQKASGEKGNMTSESPSPSIEQRIVILEAKVNFLIALDRSRIAEKDMYSMMGAGGTRYKDAFKANDEAQENLDRALAVLKRLGL